MAELCVLSKHTELNIFSHIHAACCDLMVCFFLFCQQTSAGAFEMSEIKQQKTPPPLPPKPEHGLLKSQLAAVDGTGE